MRTLHTLPSLAAFALCALIACSPKGDVKPQRSLYERLGEKNAIEAVVGEMLENVKQDERIKGKFANSNLDDLKNKLVDQICQVSGGPCTYGGKNMKEAHTGMGISGAEFTAMVEDLVKALDKFKVPEADKKELLSALGAMQKDIVENP